MREKRLSNEVYARLRGMILSAKLRPGERLLDRELAQDFGISRTPIREALSRLAQDGLVTEHAARGYLVADLDAKQIADLYDLREILELHAVRLAAERATPEDLARLASVLDELETLRDRPEMRGDEIKLGLRIHELVAAASGNAFLHETLVRLLNRMLVFIWVEMLYEDPAAAELTRREHAGLLALIREKRVQEAEALVQSHLRTAKDHILRVIKARETFYGPLPTYWAVGSSPTAPRRSAGCARRRRG